jgi:hypothetical protein
VTEAIVDYWEYFEPIRIFGPQDCVHTTQDFVEVIDGILIDNNSSELVTDLKTTFGLGNLTDTTDFVSTLANYGIGGWQGRNWDPAVGDPSFERYCSNITNTSLIYPGTASLRPAVEKLTTAAGQESSEELTTKLLNWIGYVNTTLVTSCASSNKTQDQCYGTHNQTYYDQQDYASQSWRSWSYQFCTE